MGMELLEKHNIRRNLYGSVKAVSVCVCEMVFSRKLSNDG